MQKKRVVVVESDVCKCQGGVLRCVQTSVGEAFFLNRILETGTSCSVLRVRVVCDVSAELCACNFSGVGVCSPRGQVTLYFKGPTFLAMT